jgi:hypothetical protein
MEADGPFSRTARGNPAEPQYKRFEDCTKKNPLFQHMRLYLGSKGHLFLFWFVKLLCGFGLRLMRCLFSCGSAVLVLQGGSLCEFFLAEATFGHN